MPERSSSLSSSFSGWSLGSSGPTDPLTAIANAVIAVRSVGTTHLLAGLWDRHGLADLVKERTGSDEVERAVLAIVCAIAMGVADGVDLKEWSQKDVEIPGLSRHPRFDRARRFLDDDSNVPRLEVLTVRRLLTGDIVYIGELPADHLGHGDRKLDPGTELMIASDGTLLRFGVCLQDAAKAERGLRNCRLASIVLPGARDSDDERLAELVIRSGSESRHSTVAGLSKRDVKSAYDCFVSAAALAARLHAATPAPLHSGVWLAQVLISAAARKIPDPWPSVVTTLNRVRKVSLAGGKITTIIGYEQPQRRILQQFGLNEIPV